MDEAAEEIAALQALLDESVAGSGDHLRSAFGRERWMSARQLVDALPGIFEMHLAVLSGRGAPLVAPVDALLFEGKVWVGLPAAALRSKLLRRDPRVSGSYTHGEVAFIVHGTFIEVADREDRAIRHRAAVRALYIDIYGEWFGDWLDDKRTTGGDLVGFIEPRVMFAKH